MTNVQTHTQQTNEPLQTALYGLRAILENHPSKINTIELALNEHKGIFER